MISCVNRVAALGCALVPLEAFVPFGRTAELKTAVGPQQLARSKQAERTIRFVN